MRTLFALLVLLVFSFSGYANCRFDQGFSNARSQQNFAAINTTATSSTATKVDSKTTDQKVIADQNKYPQDTFATDQDKILNQKIRDKVSNGYLFDSFKNIKLNTDNGTVTLEGQVKDNNDAQKLVAEIKNIDGVKSVDNKLQLKD